MKYPTCVICMCNVYIQEIIFTIFYNMYVFIFLQLYPLHQLFENLMAPLATGEILIVVGYAAFLLMIRSRQIVARQE